MKRILALFLVWSSSHSLQAQWANHLVISEVQVGGSTANVEFVELYNPTASPIDLSASGMNIRLRIRNSTGNSDVGKTLTFVRSTIPAYGYFLIASVEFDAANPNVADATYSTASNPLVADGSVYISTSSTALRAVIDMVGWGSGSDASGFEGSRFPTAPPNGTSIERKARSLSDVTSMVSGIDRFAGNGHDSDNNALDFISRSTPQPQNSLSAIEGPVIQNVTLATWYGTLTQALSIVGGNEELYVPSGTYQGPFSINVAGLVLKGVGATKPVINSASGAGFIIAPGVSNVTIDNFAINAQTNGVESHSTSASPSTGLTIRNCTFNSGEKGISIQYSSSLTINNTIVQNTSVSGWSIDHANLITASNNTITEVTGVGISITNSDSVTLTNNTSNDNEFGVRLEHSTSASIIGNTINGNAQVGIRLWNVNGSTISNNIANENGNLTEKTGTGIHLNGEGNALAGNTTNLNGAYGLWLEDGNGHSVDGHTSQDNGLAGIYAGGVESSVTDLTVGTVSSTGSEYGMWIRYGGNVTINQSTFNSNETGVRIDGSSNVHLFNCFINLNTTGVLVQSASNEIKIENSDLGGNTDTALSNSTDSPVLAPGNWWGSVNGPTYSGNTYQGGNQGTPVSGPVHVAPWAISATDVDAGTPGWQPLQPLFSAVTAVDPNGENLGAFSSLQAAITAVEESVSFTTEGAERVQASSSPPPQKVEAAADKFTEVIEVTGRIGMLIRGRDVQPTILDAGGGTGITVGVDGVTIAHFEIVSCTTGVSAMSADNLQVDRLKIANAQHAIHIENSNNVTILGSNLQSNAVGIYVSDVSAATVAHNFLKSNGIGVRLETEASEVQIFNNNLSDNTTYALLNNTSAVVNVRGNWWGSAAGPSHPGNTFNKDQQQGTVLGPASIGMWFTSGTDNDLSTPGWQPHPATAFSPVTTSNPAEGQFSSIQSALDAAQLAGGSSTVSLAPGTFTEAIHLQAADLTLNGAGQTSTFIRNILADETATITVRHNAVGTVIQGIHITRTETGPLIELQRSDSSETVRGFFQLNQSRLSFGGGSVGLTVTGTSGLLDGLTVNQCTIDLAVGKTGILIEDGAGVNVTVTQTDFVPVGAGGGIAIDLEGVDGITINGDGSGIPSIANADIAIRIRSRGEEVVEGISISDYKIVGAKNTELGAIVLDGSGGLIDDVEMHDLSISGGAGAAIYLESNSLVTPLAAVQGDVPLLTFANFTISNSSIKENAGGAIVNNDGNAILARFNYWGHPSGPQQPVTNVSGQGSAVSNKVVYSPWYGVDDGDASLPGFQVVRPMTYHVNESPATSIRKAIDHAVAPTTSGGPGDVVLIHSGHYPDDLDIETEGLTLQGVGETRPQISTVGEAAIEVSAPNVRLKFLDVRAQASTAISAYNSEGLRVTGCNVHSSNDGIVLSSSPGSILDSNVVKQHANNGISIVNSNAVTISGNSEINENGQNGIYVDESDVSIITNNTVCLNEGGGIRVLNSNSVTITNNTVNGNGDISEREGTGIYVSGSENTVGSNTTNENGEYGIWIDVGFNNVVQNNSASANGEAGIYIGGLTGATNTVVRDNTAYNNNPSDGGVGIKAISSSYGLFRNNTTNSNGIGLLFQSSHHNKVIEGSNEANASAGIRLVGSEGTLIAKASISGNGRLGIHVESNAAKTTIWNNTISNNGAGVGIGPTGGIYIGAVGGEGISISANVFQNNSTTAVVLANDGFSNGHMVVAMNNFLTGGHQTGGILVENPMATVVAQHNWWGDANGPQHEDNEHTTDLGVTASETVDVLFYKSSPLSLPVPALAPVTNSLQPGKFYRSITEALDFAEATGAEQTIQVSVGGFSESEGVYVPYDNLRLVGAGMNLTYVRLFGDEIALYGDGQLLEGFDLDNGGVLDHVEGTFDVDAYQSDEVVAVGGEGITVRNNRIRGAGELSEGYSWWSPPGVGVALQSATNALVEGNDILWNRAGGVLDQSGETNNRIQNNRVFLNGDKELASTETPCAGIILQYAVASQIQDNIIRDNVNHGIYVHADEALIRGNTIAGNGWLGSGSFGSPSGIVIPSGTQNTIQHNAISDNATYGIRVVEGVGNTINDNDIGGDPIGEGAGLLMQKGTVATTRKGLQRNLSLVREALAKEEAMKSAATDPVDAKDSKSRPMEKEAFRIYLREKKDKRRLDHAQRTSLTRSQHVRSSDQNGAQVQSPPQRAEGRRSSLRNVVALARSWFLQTTAVVPMGNGVDGVRLEDEGCSVMTNTIRGNGWDGIRLLSASNSTILQNTIHQNDQAGITAEDADSVRIRENTVSQNEKGVVLDGITNSHLILNSITQNGVGVEGINLSSVDFVANTLISNSSGGLLTDGSVGLRAANNTLTNNGPLGVKFGPTTGAGNFVGFNKVSANVKFDPFFGAQPDASVGFNVPPSTDPPPQEFGGTGVTVDFSNSGSGGSFTVAIVRQAPPPGPITDPDNTGLVYSFLNMYWEVVPLNSLTGFTADILFDLDGISGITDVTKLRIARRVSFSGAGVAWVLIPLSNTTLDQNNNLLKATGQTSLSQWTIVQGVQPTPTVTSVTPNNGMAGETVNVTITGTNFLEGTTTVNFGSGITVNSVTVNSPTQLVVNITIAGTAGLGSRDIVVSNGAGLAVTIGGGFTVTPGIAVLVGLSPTSGIAGQTLDVTVSGDFFYEGITGVGFGSGISVNRIVVQNMNHLTANITISLTASSGPRNVSVSNHGGTTVNTLNNAFTVVHPVPTVVSVVPDTVVRGQSTTLTVTGINFVSSLTTVSVSGGVVVDSISIQSPTQLLVYVTVPISAATGAQSVTVTNGSGASASLPNAFVIANPRPSLVALSPSLGVRGQTLEVQLTGTNFLTGATNVSFGSGITVNSLTVTNAAQLTANITIDPAAILGLCDVVVTNASPGGGSATLAGVFTVGNPAALLSSITPTSGRRGETLAITLQGGNFIAGSTTVSFGEGITVGALNVTSPTQATANIRIGVDALAGTRDVTVTNPGPGGGAATLSGAFTVLNPAPTLAGVMPSSGTRGSILNVRVTGSGFLSGVTSVDFGADVSVSNLNVRSATELSISVTISTTALVGGRTVTVTNTGPGGGAVTLANGFSVVQGTPTRVETTLELVPEEYVLHEGYPNPFNAVTKLRYAVPERARVKLEVYNMLGNVVAELVDGEKRRGYYEVSWVAENQPSGVYLVRMQAEGIDSQKRFIGSRKVVLVK